MNKYEEALLRLTLMLGGSLRREFLNNEKINEYISTLEELTIEYRKLKELLDETEGLQAKA